jgi:hypothetical protein
VIKVAHSAQWFEITKNFLKLAFTGDRREAKCLYNRCQNRRILSEYEMYGHIAKHRFKPHYLVGHKHGEVQATTPSKLDGSNDEDQMDDMIANIGMEYDLGSGDQDPLPEVQNFYRLLDATDEKVHDGTELTGLQAVTCLIGMESKYSFSNQFYNNIVKLIIDLIPAKHNMPKDLYQSKKIVAGLGMNYEKINVCKRNCMLFWKEHKVDTECMHCSRSRYVKVVNGDGASVTTKVVVKQHHYMLITPRLKQLYLSEGTTKHMRWHKEGKHDSEDSDIRSHPTDTEAWETLDHFDLEFARDPRSVLLGLSSDGFQPPTMPTVHILAGQFLSFLTIYYPTNAYLWSIHDYLAYGKFVGWCVHGRLNCLIYMDDTDVFRLQHNMKSLL